MTDQSLIVISPPSIESDATFETCNTQMTLKLSVIVGVVFLICISFLIYGMIHVSDDISSTLSHTSTSEALQLVQAELLVTQHVSYMLSVTTNAENVTIFSSLLQTQLYKLSVASEQLNIADVALGALVSESLFVSYRQCSMLIANAAILNLTNRSSNQTAQYYLTYLVNMSNLYITQLSHIQNVNAILRAVNSDVAERWSDNAEDTVLLFIGGGAFLVCGLGAILSTAIILISYNRRLADDSSNQRELAKIAAVVKDRFLNIVSHELRTPLNGVLGPLQLLSDALTVTSEHQPLIRNALASAEVLLAVINNLLDYRLLLDISVTYKDSWTSVNVHLLLSDIVAMIKPAMLAKHLQFRLLCRSRTLNGDIDDMSVWPIWVMVNKPALVHVIMNLLSNAHKYTPVNGFVTLIFTLLGIEHKEDIPTSLTASSGDVVIEMTDLEHDLSMVSASLTGSRVSQGAHARFRIDVIDTGIGIPREQLKTVFDMFSGVHQGTTRDIDGMGMGLAIASKLVQKKLCSNITVLLLPIDDDPNSVSEMPHFCPSLSASVDSTTQNRNLLLPRSPSLLAMPSSTVLSAMMISGTTLEYPIQKIEDAIAISEVVCIDPVIVAEVTDVAYPTQMLEVGSVISEVVDIDPVIVAKVTDVAYPTHKLEVVSAISQSEDINPLIVAEVTDLSNPTQKMEVTSAISQVVDIDPVVVAEVTDFNPTQKLEQCITTSHLVDIDPVVVAVSHSSKPVLMRSRQFPQPNSSRHIALPFNVITTSASPRPGLKLGASPYVRVLPPRPATTIPSLILKPTVPYSKSTIFPIPATVNQSVLTSFPMIFHTENVQESKIITAEDPTVVVDECKVVTIAGGLQKVLLVASAKASDLVSLDSMPSGDTVSPLKRFSTSIHLPRPRLISPLTNTTGTTNDIISPSRIGRQLKTIGGIGSVGSGSVVDGSPVATGKVLNADITTQDVEMPPLHILLVEDNFLNQKFALTLLAKLGHSVVLAENGQQAVDKWRATLPIQCAQVLPPKINTAVTENISVVLPLKMDLVQQPFDICLMDLSMPILDGFEACLAIRAFEAIMDKANQHILSLPIVAVSANSSESRTHCLAIGMQAYLPKPIRKLELVELLRRYGYGRFHASIGSSPQSCFVVGNELACVTLESNVVVPVVSPPLPVLIVKDNLSCMSKPNMNTLKSPISLFIPESGVVSSLLHILVVEDDLPSRQVLEAFLVKLGHTIVMAQNGLEALDLWRASLSLAVSSHVSPQSGLSSIPRVFDLCLTNLAMSVMDGFTSTSTIRSIERAMILAGHKVIPLAVIGICANAIEFKSRCLAVGMQGCIAKPLHELELIQHLQMIGPENLRVMIESPPPVVPLVSPTILSGGPAEPRSFMPLINVDIGSDAAVQFPIVSRQALALRMSKNVLSTRVHSRRSSSAVGLDSRPDSGRLASLLSARQTPLLASVTDLTNIQKRV